MGSVLGWVGWGAAYAITYLVFGRLIKIKPALLLLALVLLFTPLTLWALFPIGELLKLLGIDTNLGDVFIAMFVFMPITAFGLIIFLTYMGAAFINKKMKKRPKKQMSAKRTIQ